MEKKAWIIGMVFLSLISIIIIRLAWLSLIDGQELKTMADQQHTRSLAYYQYERGEFLDELGRNITGNVENCLVIFPAMIKDELSCAQQLAVILDESADAVYSRMQSAKEQDLSPYILKTGLDGKQIAAVNDCSISGVVSLPLAARYSPSYLAEHLLGELMIGEDGKYYGASGLEKQYDVYLDKRVDAQVVAYVDAGGSLSAENLYLAKADDPSYNCVCLTINKDYQELAESILQDYSGACVILDPYNGDILAAASAPFYDQYGWGDLAADDVYINKAFSSYPPASTFKIVMAAAGLELGVQPEPELAEKSNEKNFICDGAYNITDNYGVGCWNREGHGPVDLESALAQSCNCYFVGLGLALGGDNIRSYAEKFGLNSQIIIGYDYPDSTHISFSSQIPGDIANISIGEKGIRITPLQSAVMVSVCANGGKLVTPRLVREVTDNKGNTLLEFDSASPRQVIQEDTAQKLQQMLLKAVSEGTGTNAAGNYIAGAGKTGTSENEGVWFCGFAPADAPRWAVSVYIADGSSGGTEAAGVFHELIDSLAILDGIK